MSTARRHKKKRNFWPLKVFFITFFISLFLSFLSETALLSVPLPVAIIVLFVIIGTGIVFDILGVAVTSETVSAFNAMAAKKIKGAKQSIRLVQNASKISNVCNDVIGDICGIISGAMGAAIAMQIIISAQSALEMLVTILLSASIAALTVGGKALGKNFAMTHSKSIVFFAGRTLSAFSRGDTKDKRRKDKSLDNEKHD